MDLTTLPSIRISSPLFWVSLMKSLTTEPSGALFPENLPPFVIHQPDHICFWIIMGDPAHKQKLIVFCQNGAAQIHRTFDKILHCHNITPKSAWNHKPAEPAPLSDASSLYTSSSSMGLW